MALGFVAAERLPEHVRAEARYAAEMALELDPKLSDSHFAMSTILSLEWTWKAAEAQTV